MKKILNSYWHILILILFSLTPIIWFIGRAETLVNGIDTNFPLNPLTWIYRRFFVWDALINAGFHFSSTIAGFFFHTLQVLPYVLGLSLHWVEILSFIFWFSATVFSSWFFARLILPNSKLAQILLVCFYSFNTYLFNTWENVKVANLALAVSLPLALSVLYLLKEKRISYKLGFLFSIGVGLLASGAGINPTYILSLFLASIILTFGLILIDFNFKSAFLRLKEISILFLGIFLANLFWIIPTAYYVVSSVPASESLQGIGFTNWVDSLSQNTSLFNVLRLQGAWDWYAVDDFGVPYYIPYALKYFTNPIFLAFSIFIPVLSLISFLFTDKNKKGLYVGFSLMIIIGVFLGAGTHAPTGFLFRWLANNVPFFGIFRSPWYIFTSFVTLAYASLIGLLFSRLESKQKIIAWVLVPVIVVGNLLYNYPLVLGRIFRPGRTDSFYVKFPQYVFDSLDWVNKTDTGRILGYPDDEIEQFEWGYRGVESILQLGSNKEVLYLPLYLVESPVVRVIKELYLAIKKDQIDVTSTILPKLGIRTLFYKSDQKSIRLVLPELFKDFPVKQFDKWYFYDLSELNSLGKIYSASNYYFVYPFSKGEKALKIIDKNAIALNPDDTVAFGVSQIYKTAGSVIVSENSQLKEIDEFLASKADVKTVVPARDLSVIEYTFKIPKEGSYSPLLERYKLEDFGINPNDELTATFNNQTFVLTPLEVKDYIKYRPIYLNEGDYTVGIRLSSPNLVDSTDFQKISSELDSPNQQVKVEQENGNTFLSLTNTSPEDLKIDLNVNNFDPLGRYLISYDYQRIYGDRAKLILRQYSESSPMKIQSEIAPNFPEWKNYHSYFDPVPTKSQLQVTLQAEKTPDTMSVSPVTNESPHSFGTKLLFDNIKVSKIFSNEFAFISENTQAAAGAPTNYQKLSPVKYVGSVKDDNSSNSIVFLENFSPAWIISFKTNDGKSFKPRLAHFSGNLYANVWYVEDTPKEYQFTIYYWPQNLLYIGVAGTIISILAASYLRFNEVVKRRKNDRSN